MDLALEGAGLGIWDWDLKNNSVRYDRRWAEMLGLDVKNIKMDLDTWKERIHPDDINKCYEDIQAYLDGKKSYYENIHRMKHNNGNWIHILDRGRISKRNDDGTPLKFTGTHMDITELQQTKQIVAHNAKLASIGELASGVGHEINNPLAIIQGYISTIQKNIKKDEIINYELILKSIDKINISIERISTIVKGLRNFSRTDSENFSNFSPSDSLSETYHLLKEIYEKNGINISVKNDIKDNIQIYGNRGKFQQVLLNLISNAKDAVESLEINHISITSEINQEQSLYILKVQDNGHGIPEDIKFKIFDPFFTTKEVNKGTGIGLSLAYTFIKDMNGSLTVESKVNEGSTFIIQLPYNEIQSLEKLGYENKNINKIKGKVLIVDDEENICEILSELLTEFGLETETANNGKKALEILRSASHKFDLILSDMKMPIMDGTNLAKELRADSSLKDTKIILITGGIGEIIEDCENNKESLINSYLYKPINEQKLYELLKKQLI